MQLMVCPSQYTKDRFSLSEIKRAANNSSSLLSGSHFVTENDMNESYFSNVALRSLPDGETKMWQIFKTGMFHYISYWPVPDKKIAYQYILRFFAEAVSFLSRLYSELGYDEELLDITVSLNETEGIELSEAPQPKTQKHSEYICRIPDIRIKLERSAADFASGYVEHSARVIKELCERFNFPDGRHDKLQQNITAYLENATDNFKKGLKMHMKYLGIIFLLCSSFLCYGEKAKKDSLQELKALFEKTSKKRKVIIECKKPDDQYKLAICYYEGKGVPQDSKEAAKWLKKSAKQGHAKAQYRLGRFYYKGQGVEQDSEEAAKWFRKSAEQGYLPAQYRLAVYYGRGQGGQKKSKEAVRWYKKAAEKGHVLAQYELAVYYVKGQWLSKNKGQAAKWYKKAAEQGHVLAQYELAVCYAYGKGISKNLKEAAKWYRKSAEQGHILAQYKLAVYCEEKRIIKKPSNGLKRRRNRDMSWLNTTLLNVITKL